MEELNEDGCPVTGREDMIDDCYVEIQFGFGSDKDMWTYKFGPVHDMVGKTVLSSIQSLMDAAKPPITKSVEDFGEDTLEGPIAAAEEMDEETKRKWVDGVENILTSIPGEWVDITEQVPEEKKPLLYFFECTGVSAGYYYGIDEDYCPVSGHQFGGPGGWLTGDVTHWQYYPGSPKGFDDSHFCPHEDGYMGNEELGEAEDEE